MTLFPAVAILAIQMRFASQMSDRPSDSSEARVPETPIDYKASSAILRALASELDEDSSSAGCIVDGYVSIRLLGQGAGGQTYLAQRVHSQALVALKLLKPRVADQRAVHRAWRELEILQQLRLANVPRLLDFGPHESSLYIATEFIEGASLDRVFAAKPPETRAQFRAPIELLESIARAVQQLHERGVIHRDLKPSNIIISADRTPFIIDFGISALDSAEHSMTLTAEGDPIGTPSFMPPEQARGERSAISTRSDVYALGAIGYWLVTGQTPHDLQGLTLHSAIHRVGWETPRSARQIRPDLPPRLAAVLSKACHPDPSRRYSSALEFAEDLRNWLDGRPVSAAPPSPWQKAAQWVAHHPVLTSTVASLAIAGGILGTAGLTYWELVDHPAAVWVDPSGTYVELVSRAGQRFHRWDGPGPQSVVYANLLPAQAITGPSDLVLVAMDFDDDADSCERLRVFAINDPDVPLWQTPTRPPGIQRPPEAHSWDVDDLPESYRVSSVHVADFYPELRGQEVLITFRHDRKSPSCIRIYTLDGQRILYEAWHNGQIKAASYLPGDRLVVFCGVTDSPKLHDLHIEGNEFRDPVMLVALRLPREPDSGERMPRLLDSWNQEPKADFAWSRMVMPIEAYEFCSFVKFTHLSRNAFQLDLSTSRLANSVKDEIHLAVTAEGLLENAWPDGGSRDKYGSLASRIELIAPGDVEAWIARQGNEMIAPEPTAQDNQEP